MGGGNRANARKEEHPDVEEWQVAKEYFLSFEPPEYFGSTDPSVTWNWIMEIEEIFDVCGCDEQHKVKLAIRMLRGWGLEWWATINTGKTKAWFLDWVYFKDRLTKDFHVEEYKSKLESDFLKLKKESMSVEEYAHEFVKHMRKVKHLIADEKYKISRFIWGLPKEYSQNVGEATTLTEAVFRAKSREEQRAKEQITSEEQRAKEEITSEREDCNFYEFKLFGTQY